ncbi:putative cell wall protein [Gastrolobium bilobum]|uniref:putative cell wall protein n=1 Tax=Gastrolobium bilobum TaxID=150636 RepID=UPI002AAF5A5C|nr:putative cell wall protein [Gastrolobium bilobum]
MAYKASSFLAFLLISNIMLATTWQAVAGRHIIPKISNTQDKKEPQFFFKSDGSVYIPGIGRVGLPPPLFGVTPQNPYTGGSGGAGSGSAPAGHSYVPGGDDTFVPNPGFEVPNPGNGGGVPNAVHP